MSVYISSVGGIMVSIAAFQAVDPGSIPGHRIFIFSYQFVRIEKNRPLVTHSQAEIVLAIIFEPSSTKKI
jgi:hypothetical protein